MLEVAPIRLLDADDLLTCGRARQDLGLDMDRPAILLQLGSGNHSVIVPAMDHILGSIEQFGDIQTVVVEWLTADRALDYWPHVKRLLEFPNAKYFRAFDCTVSAVGYNSFHELLHFGIPTVFVPVEVGFLDNQLGRAEFAAAEGLAFCLRLTELKNFPGILKRAMDPTVQTQLINSYQQLRRPNGAETAARLVADMVSK